MKANPFALLLSLPIALTGAVAIAQQANQEEICQPIENPRPTTTKRPQPVVQKVGSPFPQAEAAEKAGNFAQVETIWRQAIRDGANYASAYFELGEALRLQRKFEEAIANYQKAIELDPSDGSACAGWTQAYLKSVKPYIAGMELYPSRGQESAYIECARLRIKLQPDRYDFYEYLGIVLYKTGRFDEAITTFRESIRLMPCDVDFVRTGQAVEYLAHVLWLKSRLNETSPAYAELNEMLPIYDKLIRRYPKHASTLYLRKGEKLIDMKRPAEAIEAFRQSIALEPEGSEYPKLLIKDAEQMLKSR